MKLSRVLAILLKDARDALRDGRILVALLLPIGLAVFYNATTPAEDELPAATVVVVDPDRTGLATRLERAAADSVELKLESAPDAAAARRAVDADDASLAVVATGQGRADVLLPEDADAADQTVAALVPSAVGQAPAVRVQQLPVDAAAQEPAELLDQRAIVVVSFVVMFVGFVALLVVPITIAEELETGTFGALRLAATGPEILAAKVLNGLLYGALGIAATVLITGLDVDEPLPFLLAALLLTLSVTGFGLLLGVVTGNANQINSYAGFMLLPVVILAFGVLLVDGGALDLVFDVLPFSQASRLMFDAVSPEQLFAAPLVSWLVVVAWAVAGFALLGRLVNRREV
jgi:ABC-2 family transporter protein